MLDPLADAVITLMNNELRNKRECTIWRASKLVGNVLRVMQRNGYIGEFEFIDDGRSGKFRVQLLGRINKCGVIKPRHSANLPRLENFEKQFLPSREIGLLILTTSQGVLSHKEARDKRVSGRVLAYVY